MVKMVNLMYILPQKKSLLGSVHFEIPVKILKFEIYIYIYGA